MFTSSWSLDIGRCLVMASLAIGHAALSAADSNSVQAMLKRPILETNTPLAEVQAYTESRVPRMPEVKSAAEWEKLASRMRRDTLEHIIFRGAAAEKWRKGRAKVVWLDTLPGGPGYHIKKLRYEALPGLWIPALLYEPENLSGKVPVVLNVNGHEPVGKSVAYKQIRCINEAKRGMLALNPEWLGMGQLRSLTHPTMNQLDLCGVSGVAPFFLAMQRGLDVLLAHKNADPDRLAVAGLSGGGWQTIILSSLDTRVKLANPVAGYSSFRTRARFLEDLGECEQTPSDMATITDYAQLTAMMAPRPTLLTYNASDNCCFAADHALPPLLDAAAPVFKLYGKDNFLRSHINYVPGDHNFAQDNREAFYRMLGEFFSAKSDFLPLEIPCEDEVKSNAVLNVEIPTNNATFNSLALALSKELPRQTKIPVRPAAFRKWQQENRQKLAQVVRAKELEVRAAQGESGAAGQSNVVFWRLKVDGPWTVPAVELVRGEPKATSILVGDAGRQGLAAQAEQLLAAGHRVLAVDPFYFGESKISSHDWLFALMVATVGERPLGIQAGQLGAVARWATNQFRSQPVRLVAVGPRSCTYALVAAALEENPISEVELYEPLGSFKEIIEQNNGVNQKPELFCFGLLEAFDVKHLAALVAPKPLIVHKASERAQGELKELAPVFSKQKGELRVDDSR